MEHISESDCSIRLLSEDDIAILACAYEYDQNSVAIYQHYLHEQQYDHRKIWLAFKNGMFAGFITLKWSSNYANFKNQNIPEIMDLQVVPQWRRQGIGSLLLTAAEEQAKERSAYVGLGVGLYAEYGAAQRLYFKHGYIPDGVGITYNYDQV